MRGGDARELNNSLVINEVPKFYRSPCSSPVPPRVKAPRIAAFTSSFARASPSGAFFADVARHRGALHAKRSIDRGIEVSRWSEFPRIRSIE